jgi:adenosylhomocysteine nucleosidase
MSESKTRYVVLVSADAEWHALRRLYPQPVIGSSPFGEYFAASVTVDGQERQLMFAHGGWGKIAAAASSQYVIDYWKPELLINIGTCGAFDASLQRGDLLLANKTLVYDIVEQMGDPDEAVKAFTTEIDISWAVDALGDDVRPGLLVSADRDVAQSAIKELRTKYGAVAADWESGSIAWVAHRNNTKVLILRGVSDIVSETQAPAYGDPVHFEEGVQLCIKKAIACLPQLLSAWEQK